MFYFIHRQGAIRGAERHTAQNAGNGSTCTITLIRFCNLFLSGRGRKEIPCWVCGAPLTALKKGNDGVRPISVAETRHLFMDSSAIAHVSSSPRTGFDLFKRVSQ